MSNDFSFQGPDRIYKPSIDGLPRRRPVEEYQPAEDGYYDLDYLERLLNDLAGGTGVVFSMAGVALSRFSLKLDTSDAALMAAHEQVYPADETPGYITFDEYKYLLTRENTNQVQILRSFYETRLRGPKGIHVLDVALIARSIHAEVERVRHFILNYVGELDETAEHRTIEQFQDWAEAATISLEKLKEAVTTKVSAQLPQSELDKLDSERAAYNQVLFQTKLNEINRQIKDAFAALEKNWNSPAHDFYDKKLGPALLFQTKIGRGLADPSYLNETELPVLAREAKATITGLASNYTVALADQFARNSIFAQAVNTILVNIDQRDACVNYINQLESKGKKIPSPFVDSSTVEQAAGVLGAVHPLSHITESTRWSTGMRPSHFDLADRYADDAHPQYFPKAGGTIEGDVELAEDVLIDGIRPSRHKHNGLDGSEKISGSDILYGSIGDDVVSPDPTTSVPENLAVTNQTAIFDGSGTSRFVTEVVFSVDNAANIVGYEFEVTKLS